MSDTPLPTGTPPEDPDAALAAEYVLRLLDPPEEAACAARIARDPAFAAQVARWRATFEALDGQFEAAAPPSGMQAAVEARLFGRPRSLAARLWDSAGLWRGVAAVAVVAGVAATLLLGDLGRAPVAEAPLVATVAPAASAPAGVEAVQMVALLDRQSGRVRFTRIAGAAPAGSSLELWILPEGQTSPASLGVVPAESEFTVALPPALAAQVAPGTAILVSLEAEGGSPTGQAQGPVLASGAIGAI